MLACITITALSGCGVAHAQTPDAGALLQQIEKEKRNPLPPKSEPQLALPQPLQSFGSATVTVKEFRFIGNTLLTSKELAARVAGFANRAAGFTDLQNAAIAVATAYRKAGWVVRAYLPEQDVSAGMVTIQIVESKFGHVYVEGRSKRVSTGRLKSIVETAQTPEQLLSAASLDRALLLIGDMPGLRSTGRLSEGLNQAETDLVLAVTDGPLVSGDVDADNTGARSTGAARVIASASLNSPVGIGDRADVLLLHSHGSDYGRAAYSVPIGSGGWHVGLNTSHLSYNVVTPQLGALDAHGTSSTAGVDASYPLLRARLRNLYFSFTADGKRFDNQSAGVTVTHYKTRTEGVGLYGNLFDAIGGGGANTASLTLAQGKLDLAGSPNEAADALTTRSAGNFEKLTASASRQQAVTDHLSVYARISGQFASKNLDSSEKFYLGGATGVRAYPEDEGGGAQGVLLNLEARSQLPWNLNLTGFLDWGSIRVNKNNNINGAAEPNTESLKGVGVSFGWLAKSGISLTATAARRLGNNPNRTSTGTDQDGSLIRNRLWLQASVPF
jgi:hemolysin activation/secretion protein